MCHLESSQHLSGLISWFPLISTHRCHRLPPRKPPEGVPLIYTLCCMCVCVLVYVLWTEFCSALTPNVAAPGDRVFRRLIEVTGDHYSRDRNPLGRCSYNKKEKSLPCKDAMRRQPGRELSPRTKPFQNLDLGLRPSQMVRVCGISPQPVGFCYGGRS